jgi:LAO/AO transport system kinase
VVTKSDLGPVATGALRDVRAALGALGSSDTPVVAVSALAPVRGVDELLAVLDQHRAGIDVSERRLATRRAGALADFISEHGQRGLRALGGRRAAARWLAEQEVSADVPGLVSALERRASAVEPQSAPGGPPAQPSRKTERPMAPSKEGPGR